MFSKPLTDRIDLLQLHNIRMDQVSDDALWKTVEELKASGKIRYYGVSLCRGRTTC